jgi:hypothetical protein
MLDPSVRDPPVAMASMQVADPNVEYKKFPWVY